MTATTVDRDAVKSSDRTRELPVAASTTIYLGSFVALNASGYLVSLTNDPTLRFAGVAGESVDNSSGSNGDLTCMVYRREVHEFVSSGLTAADAGKRLYAPDNQTVTTTPTDQFVGFLARYKSATVAPVDIQDAVQPTGGEVGNAGYIDAPVAASTTIVANTMVAIDSTGYLVPANDATADQFYGIALEGADNSTGSDGDINCMVDTQGVHELTIAGATQASVGLPVWVSNATTVTTTPGDLYAGILEEFSDATTAHVRIDDAVLCRRKRFTICGTYIGAVGDSGVKGLEDFEYARKFRVLASYADAQTAPGGAYVCTITLTDGATSHAMTITGAATHGENETATATPMLAATDVDVDLVDDDASGATADVKFVFICEEL